MGMDLTPEEKEALRFMARGEPRTPRPTDFDYRDIKADTAPSGVHEEPFEDIDIGIWELARDMGWDLEPDIVAAIREKAKMTYLERMAYKWVYEALTPPEPPKAEYE